MNKSLPQGGRATPVYERTHLRRFVALTTEKLTEWMARPLGDLDVWAVFIDGIHFGEHVVLCALGIDATGAKHVLSLWEGAMDKEIACKTMLENLSARGLKPNRSRLFIIDGSKGLRAEIRSVFGKRTLVQRCQVHKVATSSDISPTTGTPKSALRCVKHTSV